MRKKITRKILIEIFFEKNLLKFIELLIFLK